MSDDIPRIGAPPPVKPAAHIQLVTRDLVAIGLTLEDGKNAALMTRDQFEELVHMTRRTMGWW